MKHLLCIAAMAACVSCSNRSAPIPANAEQKLAVAWVADNEGDPGSVEWIALEGPRPGISGGQLVRAKYRATGPMGGPVVHDRVFIVRDDGLDYNDQYRWPEL